MNFFKNLDWAVLERQLPNYIMGLVDTVRFPKQVCLLEFDSMDFMATPEFIAAFCSAIAVANGRALVAFNDTRADGQEGEAGLEEQVERAKAYLDSVGGSRGGPIRLADFFNDCLLYTSPSPRDS